MHPLETLLALDSEAPDTVHWHGVFQRQQMVAACISLVLSERWCRIHGMGDVGNLEREHPSAILVAHLHAWCASRGIQTLDLGLASEAGIPDEPRIAMARVAWIRIFSAVHAVASRSPGKRAPYGLRAVS